MEKQQKITTIDPLFKGCTRPAMLVDVPMVPMIVVCLLIFVPGIWLLIFRVWNGAIGLALIFGVLPACIWWMRDITKKDDYRLDQLIMRITLRIRQANRALWGKGVAAYSPIQCRRRWR